MRIGIDAGMLGRGGGIAAYTEALVTALAAAGGGHALVLWCATRDAGPAARRLSLPGVTILAPGPAGRALDRLGRVTEHPIPLESLVGPVDVFHGLNYLLPARRGRAALVLTVHDLSALRHPQWHPPGRALMHRAALGRTVRRADHVIADSEAIRGEILAEFHLPPQRVTAVPLAASPAFRPRRAAELRPDLARWGLSPGGYLLFAGPIEPRKNIGGLLDALGILRTRRRDLPPLVLAGPRGWRNRELHARLAAAAPHARYLGLRQRQEVAALMAGCAAFVFPSLYEGFGLPVLEAMASGAPVITSRGGALEELAGDAAILVDPLDPGALAAAIERVLGDAGLREAFGARALARAARFSWDRTAQETLEVYERALAVRGAGQGAGARPAGP